MLLGAIGDDFTGSGDLANTLVRSGMRTTLFAGVPDAPAEAEVEAGVVALKTRSAPVEEAVAASLAALDWLRDQGCTQILFKYCSTFDSTPEGNIGPVADALADALEADRAFVCPAFPATGRTLYQGHLFVGNALLSESGMQDHPLTPMTDPDLRRWLQRQSRSGVGHVSLATVREGAEAVAARVTAEAAQGRRLIVTDAVVDEDLHVLGRAAADHRLVTGGSGVALGLPENFRREGLLAGRAGDWIPQRDGRAVVLSGSCSRATRGQISEHAAAHPARKVTPEEVIAPDFSVDALAEWVTDQEGLPLIYSSDDPEVVSAAQDKHGRDRLAHAFDGLFSDLARHLAARGFTRIVSAGGETSGAVVEGLGTTHLAVGPQIAPGVPMLRAGPDLTLALKSGNFGEGDFFTKAEAMLKGDA